MILQKSKIYEKRLFPLKKEKFNIQTAEKGKYEKLYYYYYFSRQKDKLFHAYSRSDTKYVKYIEKLKRDIQTFIGKDIINKYEIHMGALNSGCPENLDYAFTGNYRVQTHYSCDDGDPVNSSIVSKHLDTKKIENIPFILYILLFVESYQKHLYISCKPRYAYAIGFHILTNPRGRMRKVFLNSIVKENIENIAYGNKNDI